MIDITLLYGSNETAAGPLTGTLFPDI